MRCSDGTFENKVRSINFDVPFLGNARKNVIKHQKQRKYVYHMAPSGTICFLRIAVSIRPEESHLSAEISPEKVDFRKN